MALVAGSYERFIWGFSLKTLNSNPGASSQTLTLAPLFSYPAHSGPIRCCAAATGGGAAASGGADDAVRLYDLAAAADLGSLLDASAAVSSIAFFSPPSHPSLPRNLLTASDDGFLRVYDADGYVLLTSLRAFRDGISGVAVHPSGRVALATGRGGGLAMLNLIRGRRSFTCRLERPASAIAYAADADGGDRFVLATDDKVSVHDSEDAKIVHELDCARRVLCVAPAKSGIVYCGGEDRGITAWDLASGKVSCSIPDAHSTRVKGLVVFDTQHDGSELCNLIASASSDGLVRVWDVRMIGKEKPVPVAEANTKARLTCLAGTSLKC